MRRMVECRVHINVLHRLQVSEDDDRVEASGRIIKVHDKNLVGHTRNIYINLRLYLHLILLREFCGQRDKKVKMRLGHDRVVTIGL